jgi:hypothetical protein
MIRIATAGFMVSIAAAEFMISIAAAEVIISIGTAKVYDQQILGDKKPSMLGWQSSCSIGSEKGVHCWETIYGRRDAQEASNWILRKRHPRAQHSVPTGIPYVLGQRWILRPCSRHP